MRRTSAKCATAWPASWYAVDCSVLLAGLAVTNQPDADVRDAYVRYLEAVTKYLLDLHWYLVEAVAAALLERETLSGVQIHRTIRAAIVEADPHVATLPTLTAYGWRRVARSAGAQTVAE
jgi:hypothetical protein